MPPTTLEQTILTLLDQIGKENTPFTVPTVFQPDSPRLPQALMLVGPGQEPSTYDIGWSTFDWNPLDQPEEIPGYAVSISTVRGVYKAKNVKMPSFSEENPICNGSFFTGLTKAQATELLYANYVLCFKREIEMLAEAADWTDDPEHLALYARRLCHIKESLTALKKTDANHLRGVIEQAAADSLQIKLALSFIEAAEFSEKHKAPPRRYIHPGGVSSYGCRPTMH